MFRSTSSKSSVCTGAESAASSPSPAARLSVARESAPEPNRSLPPKPTPSPPSAEPAPEASCACLGTSPLDVGVPASRLDGMPRPSAPSGSRFRAYSSISSFCRFRDGVVATPLRGESFPLPRRLIMLTAESVCGCRCAVAPRQRHTAWGAGQGCTLALKAAGWLGRWADGSLPHEWFLGN